jgi:hypothetical protein
MVVGKLNLTILDKFFILMIEPIHGSKEQLNVKIIESFQNKIKIKPI